MELIPECFNSKEKSIKITEKGLLEIIELAFYYAPSEVGVNLGEEDKLEGLCFGADYVPRKYRFHSHPAGIAFPSDGDLETMAAYFDCEINHNIISINADLKRAILRSIISSLTISSIIWKGH